MTRKRNQSTLAALGGICAALSVVLMLVSSIIPLATYIAPMLAGIALLPMKEEMGSKSALLSYLACSILCVFLVPEKECVMMFIFLLGWYPIAKDYLDRIKSKLLRFLTKLAVFNISTFLGYYLLIKLLSMEYILEEFGGAVLFIVTVITGNIAFIVYDISLVLLKKFYYLRVRKLFGIR